MYAQVMELNVWTSTTIQGKTTFDLKTRTWTVFLERPNHATRKISPRHIIVATGQAGDPHAPQFPGLSQFKGDVFHSSEFRCASKYHGKRAVVVGCGNSAHDIAMQLHEQGAANVTMIQRSSTYVMYRDYGVRNLFCGY